MQKGNVLVIGNSGVGKSTLINAVLGEESAETGWGTEGTTRALAIYENSKVPFRAIDTVGFEPSFTKALRAVNAVRKWSKNSAVEDDQMRTINVIWFCVDGTSSKLFAKTLKDLSRATALWPSVPVIVVITKSYSMPERAQSIQMVKDAFAKQKRFLKRLRNVIPVVASAYVLNAHAYAAPEGIAELIDATNALMPEGIRAGEKDIAAFKLSRKRALAHGITGISTTAAAVVAAVPIPFADALILAPIELALVNALAQLYDVGKDETSKRFLNSIVEVGTVGVAAKTAISALKAIPGVNLGASVLNAIIAGSIVAALGEGSIYAFEQVYLGKKSVSDTQWVKKVMESKFSSQFVEMVAAVAAKATPTADSKTIVRLVSEVSKKFASTSGEEKT
ncbi:YcjF family protein [Fusibacter sp. JL298sf-3]